MNDSVRSYDAECTSGSVCGESKVPKFVELTESARGIDGVIDHLRELQYIIGIRKNETVEVPCSDQKKSCREPSLIVMLDDLPQELRMKSSIAHDLINEITSQLN